MILSLSKRHLILSLNKRHRILSLNKRHLIVTLGFFLLHTVVLAQEPVTVERSNNKVILEGTVYYIHVIKPGQTLYSIAKVYNISQKEIAIENPGVISGLQLGQALKIPVEPAMEEEVDTSDIEQFEETGRTHIVNREKPFTGLPGILMWMKVR